MQIVLAALKINTEELIDRNEDSFLAEGEDKHIAKVQYEYWQQRRKNKLVQIENAIRIKKGNNPFLTLGISSAASHGITGLSKRLKESTGQDRYVIKDPHVSRLIGNLSNKSNHISQTLKQISQASTTHDYYQNQPH